MLGQVFVSNTATGVSHIDFIRRHAIHLPKQPGNELDSKDDLYNSQSIVLCNCKSLISNEPVFDIRRSAQRAGNALVILYQSKACRFVASALHNNDKIVPVIF